MKRDVQRLFNQSLQKKRPELSASSHTFNRMLEERTLRTGVLYPPHDPNPDRIAADMPSRLKCIEMYLTDEFYDDDDQRYALEANMEIINSGKPIEEIQSLLKGAFMGLCNVSACQEPPATWFNRGTDKYYCQPCAFKINGYDNDPLCYRGKKKTE